MTSYITFNIFIVLVIFVGIVFYEKNRERDDHNERRLYGTLYILYTTYVGSLVINKNNRKVNALLIAMAITAIIAYIFINTRTSRLTKVMKSIQNIGDTTRIISDGIQKFNHPYVYIFNDAVINRQCSLEFMIYLDVTNSMREKVKVLQLNDYCTIIEYNNENHTFELVQYSCLGETKHNVPVSYNKWIKIKVEFVKGYNSEPLLLGIKIDDNVMYNSRLYDMNSSLQKITIGDNSSRNLGFMKNIIIRSS